jgi:hypothetical protein
VNCFSDQSFALFGVVVKIKREMNQSVYKRDFRDPRDIMRLWKFLLNENLESNLEHNDGGGSDSKAATGDCSIKSREGEESYAQPPNVDVSRTQSELIINNRWEQNENLLKSKSLTSLPIPSVSFPLNF